MTGFGRFRLKSAAGFTRAEIKTVNHRYFEFSARLSPHLSEYEDEIRRRVAGRLSRGKITLTVSSPDPAVFASRLILNEPLAKEVFHQGKRLQTVLKIKKPSEWGLFKQVLNFPDVLVKDVSSARSNGLPKDAAKALEGALAGLEASRLREGRALAADILKHARQLERSLSGIGRRLPGLKRAYRASLARRVGEFLKNGELDGERLTAEAAQHVKSSDVSEEIARLKAHLAELKKTLRDKGEAGRKLDFIAQEVQRETNTLGAKSQDVVLAREVIAMKGAIEKIREQAQNVE